jgi:hypothetical protein
MKIFFSNNSLIIEVLEKLNTATKVEKIDLKFDSVPMSPKNREALITKNDLKAT